MKILFLKEALKTRGLAALAKDLGVDQSTIFRRKNDGLIYDNILYRPCKNKELHKDE